MGQDRVREPDVGRPRAQDSHKGQQRKREMMTEGQRERVRDAPT